MLTIEVSTVTPAAETICNLSLGKKERITFERLIEKLVADSWDEDKNFELDADQYMLLDRLSRKFEKLSNT